MEIELFRGFAMQLQSRVLTDLLICNRCKFDVIYFGNIKLYSTVGSESLGTLFGRGDME